MKFLKGFLINLQFFTSVPITSVLPMDEEHLRSSIKSFPLVGLVQGFFYSFLAYLLVEWTPFSPLAVAFILWLFMIILTGGIHLDGWMDASDAFFSYQSPERRLEIMKDSRVGAFGVLSVMVLLSCRFLFIYEIIGSINTWMYPLILFIPFLSKGVMGAVLLTVPSAKKDGLASLFQKAGNSRDLAIYPVYLMFLLFILSFILMETLLPVILLTAVALLSYFIIRSRAMKWFGGITGDVVGASVEGTEVLLWMNVWLLHYFVMG